MESLKQRVADSAAAFVAVFSNPNLRRLELAAVGSTLGSWAYSVAVSVYAYEHGGGAKGVGLVWLIRVLPAGLLSPVGGIVADRFPRERVMLASSLVRVVLIAVAAACVWVSTLDCGRLRSGGARRRREGSVRSGRVRDRAGPRRDPTERPRRTSSEARSTVPASSSGPRSPGSSSASPAFRRCS